MDLSNEAERASVEVRFLYFPDEHHWVAKPNNARIWYETVLSFINHYARGRKWSKPGLL